MIIVQTFNRAGWPADSPIEVSDGMGAALLTAVHDYEAERHVDLHGDILADPVGGKRTPAQVVEMRAAFRAPRTSELWLTIGREKYNMDPRSTAIPSLTSPHLRGDCGDIADNGFLAWLKSPDPQRPGHNIASRYGLVFTLLKENDLRHAQFFPGTNTVALDVTSLNNTTSTEEDDMSTPTAKDNTKTGSAKFGYIAVAVNGQLHEIAPGNRGFWGTLQAIYPGLAAADVDQLGYDTFVAANSPTDVSASIAALTPAITAAVAAAVKANPGAGAAAIAKAVDAALADNFALLPKQVVQAEGAALSNS